MAATEKRSLKLNLSDREWAVLEELATEKGMNKTAVLRQALRLYQSISIRTNNGEKIYFEDPAKNEKAELLLW